MKKSFIFFSLLFVCVILYSEELTGFFGFNLGDSLEVFQQNEVFELCEEVDVSDLFCDNDKQINVVLKNYNIDYTIYKLSLLLEYDHDLKHKKIVKIKEDNKTKNIYLYTEFNVNKNNKRLLMRDSFKYAGVDVNAIYFVFMKGKLVSVKLAEFNRARELNMRYEKENGYIIYVPNYMEILFSDDYEGFPHLLNDNREAGFDFLRETVSEKYNFTYSTSRIISVDNDRNKKIWSYRYISKDLSKSIYFSYDRNYGKFDNESIQIVDEEILKNAVDEVKRIRKEMEEKKHNEAKQDLLDKI